MRFEIDEEHYEFASVVHQTLSRAHSIGLARRLFDGSDGEVAPLLSQLDSVGVTSMTVPVEFGGAGLGMSDSVLTLEVLGRHLAPDFIGLSMAASPVIANYAPPTVADELLTKLARGEWRMSVQDGWDAYAPWARVAHVVAVVDDDTAYLVVAKQIESRTGTDYSRVLGRASMSAPRIGVMQGAAASELRWRATTATAAILFGTAVAMIEAAARYASQRKQFGVPIGSFQGVKHQLADAFAAVEAARRVAWWAAYCIDHKDPDAARASAMAKALIGEAAAAASYAALQAYGGAGYMWDTDLHMWMKRAQSLSGSWGDTSAQWRFLRQMS